eukprot:TRINITY_DN12977_c0_g1_i4.p1 TRINITY_DN12977_c0_g1~~TRINITY_DN12977_c0_g1_i4.p1  ORF type:complete len:629 (+),score=161.54 TRINITY_DN12977_c0_g1_i4:100-1986(+)
MLPETESSSTQTEENMDPDVYERLFLVMNQPVMVFDLNYHNEIAKPFLLNPAASTLIESSNDDFFQESLLEKFNVSLGNFVRSVRGKVAQEVSYTDVLHVSVTVNSKPCEIVFAFTATTFELRDATRILGVLLMETSRIVEEEIKTVESFKASLVSALSHELNNPINSLIPLIKLMPDVDRKDSGEDLKSMALSSAYILKNKIRDLVDYASIETQNMSLNFEEFCVEDLFDELKKIFKVETERKSNALKFSIITYANRRLKILADQNRLEQILIKLIMNANKYTNEGTISVTAEECQANFNVIFTVKDTGVGIPKEKLNLIFAPLNHKYRLSGEYAKLPGLGLEIAKGICQCMDSKLNVQSTTGRGTTFSFEIPTCRLSTFECPEPSVDDKEELVILEPANSCDFNTQLADLRDLKATRSSFFNREEVNRQALKKDFSSNLKFPSCNDDKVFAALDGVIDKIVQYNSYIKKSADSVFHYSGATNSFRVKQSVVLVTDDMYSNRLVLRKVLENFRVQSVEAINGEEAVRSVEKSFDDESSLEIVLILMDLHMPVMNGIDATIKIRELEKKYKRRKKIPIIAVTAHDGIKDQEGCLKAGMQEYIMKPATSAMLKRMVIKYIPDLVNVDTK